MVYRRSTTNIRRPRRARRRPAPRPRRRTTRRAPRRVMRRQMSRPSKPCPGELSPSLKFALSQLDPFEPRCLGAKIPDSNTIPSIANCDTDQVNMGFAAAGTLSAMVFAPSYNYATLGSTAANPVLWTNSWNQRRNYDNVIAAIEAIRPVSHALRISSALSPTAATGFVHIGLSVESRASSIAGTAQPDYPKTVNQMTGLQHYQRVTVASLTQSPLTVINKWIDDTGFRYDDPRSTYAFNDSVAGSSTLTFNFQQSWAVICVMVEGAPPNSTPLSFEHLLLTEAIPRKDGFVIGTQAAPNSPTLLGAVSQMVSEQPFAHTEDQQATYLQNGFTRLQQGIQQAGSDAAQVAGPLLQQVGYGAGRYAINTVAGVVGSYLGVQTANRYNGMIQG